MLAEKPLIILLACLLFFCLSVQAADATRTRVLSLQDAILLALRYNADVVNSELQRIVDKYELLLVQNQFEPHYAMGVSAITELGQHPYVTQNIGMSFESSLGTQYQLSYSNNSVTHPSGTAQIAISQPLLQGFGLVNAIPLLNAYDQAEINSLTRKNNIITAVVNVITNYLNLVEAYQNMDIEAANLKQISLAEIQDKLRVKAGEMSLSDLRLQQANLQQSRLSFVMQKNSLQVQYQNFLQALGIKPEVNVKIDSHLNFLNKIEIPDQEKSIQVALAHNIAYQQALIALQALRREIFKAEDAKKWQLNLAVQKEISDKFNVINVKKGAAAQINLTIPIDNFQINAQLVVAKINYDQAKLRVQQLKENLIRGVITQHIALENLKNQIQIAKIAVQLQKRNWKDALLKFQYGKASMFEVVSEQSQYMQQQQALLSNKIMFQIGLTQFYQALALTLEQWHVCFRSS